MELLLIRHGLPVRVEHADGKAADPSLSQKGAGQVERLRAWLASESIDHVVSSPLRRARETAAPLVDGRGLALEIDPALTELDYGRAAYIPLEELKRIDYARWRDAVSGGLYAGVDMTAFRRTVVDALERIIASHPGRRVAVACHGGVINAWAGNVLGIKEPFFFDPTYTSINRFLCAGSGERMVVSLNEAAHLRRSPAEGG